MADVVKKYWFQCLLLVIVSSIFTFPKIIHTGTNVVTNTYEMGADRFWSGELPYKAPSPGADYFKYSPFFAMIYLPLARLGSNTHPLLWAFLNILVFWMGISAWFRFYKPQSKWLWGALLVCSMELNGPVLYQQINALLIGLTLLGLAKYRDGKEFSAGCLLMLATNFKILPGLFLFGLLLQFRPRYLAGVFFMGVLTFLLPTLALGLKLSFHYHTEWFSLLFHDANQAGILDIATAFGKVGLADFGRMLRLAIMFLSIALIGVSAFNQSHIPWPSWIASASACLLLVNPLTESPTFVLIAPTYLFLTAEILKKSDPPKSLWLFGVLYTGIFFITICYNDLWPHWLWNPHGSTNTSKAFGSLILWGLAVYYLGKECLSFEWPRRSFSSLFSRG